MTSFNENLIPFLSHRLTVLNQDGTIPLDQEEICPEKLMKLLI